MRKFSIKTTAAAGAIFLGIIATIPAHATTFDFTVISVGAPGDSGSGTFIGTETLSGVYTLTGITGTFDGSAITQLSTYADADNQLFFPSQTFVDFGGISFVTANPLLGAINLFSNSGSFEVKSTVDSVGYYFNGTPISLSVTATPLPSSWTMMLIGLAAFGFVAYRRKAKPEFMMA
jgi:PEP-CTERM motif